MRHTTRIVFPLALGLSGELLAIEPAGQLFTVDEIQVNATKIAESEQNIARTTSVIEMNAPANNGVQSVAQSLDFETNIVQSGGPRSSVQSINIRGLGGNRVLQTIDGVPQTFQSGHRASYFLDPALIQRVEVVKGPTSSIYGSGAIGGLVAQETIDPEDLIQGGADEGGFLKAMNNANNQQQDLVAGLGLRSGAFDWLISGYYKDGDDIKLGNGDTLEHSAERSKGTLLKQNWFVSPNDKIGLSYRNESLDGQIPSNGSAPVNGSSVFVIQREQSNQNALADYQHESTGGGNVFNANLYWDNIQVDESRLGDGRADKTEQDTLGISVDNVSEFSAFTVLVGGEARQTDFNGERGGVPGTRPIIPDAETKTSGVYAQVNTPLLESSSSSAESTGTDYSLNLELGLRYDDFSSEAKNLSQKSNDDDLSKSVALVWRQNEELTIALRYDEAFRAPSAEELYTSGAHFCMGPGFCNTFLPNPGLAPEKAQNKELIVKSSLRDVLGADEFGVTFSVFQNDVDDFIAQIVEAPSFGMGPPSAGNTYNVNVEEAQLKGFELSTSYRLASLTARLGYGQVRGKDKLSGEDLTNIPADKITAQLTQALADNAHIGARVSHTQDQNKTRYAENSNNTVYDDYTTLDVFGAWSPESLEHMTFNMNLNNLTNRYYRKTWSQLDAAGREVILSASYRF